MARPKVKPLLVGALGGRGTGKSAWVRQQLRAVEPDRLAVWDLMGESADLGQVFDGRDPAALGACIRAMRGRAFRVVFKPHPDAKRRAAQFDAWCRALMAAGNTGGPLLAYVEELAFVTTASHAPAGWREVCLLGRHAGVSVIATSQRPSQVDKEFMGNLDALHCGRLAHRADAQTAADLLGVTAAEVQTMPDLHWLERRAGAAGVVRGKLEFSKPPAKPRPAPGGRRPKGQDSTAGGGAADSAGTDQPPDPDPESRP